MIDLYNLQSIREYYTMNKDLKLKGSQEIPIKETDKLPDEEIRGEPDWNQFYYSRDISLMD